MLDRDTINIISALTKKTKQKEAIWNEGNIKGEYQLILNDAMITIANSVNIVGIPSYSFTIYNDNGIAIESYSVDTLGEDMNLLDALYDAVEDAVLKRDSTKKSILSQLTGVLKVGKHNDPPF